MQQLESGEFFGNHDRVLTLPGLVVTDTVYTHPTVDWHYHQNPYFTFLLQGRLDETSRKGTVGCTPGTLLFHHWQDAHRNVRRSEQARGFHVEVSSDWFARVRLPEDIAEGSHILEDRALQSLFLRMHRELHLGDQVSGLSIDDLLLQSFNHLVKAREEGAGTLAWVARVRTLLQDEVPERLTIERVSAEAAIHPVHLSRSFRRYFATSFSDYLRRRMVERAELLLLEPGYSLADVAHACGFADQSHFIRCFRTVHGFTPGQYRKRLMR